jgi:hypothetical protein
MSKPTEKLIASRLVDPSYLVAAGPVRTKCQVAGSTTLARLLYDFLIPTTIYTVGFFLLTYPLIWKWSSSFYGDSGDGLQNEWNLWWFHKAVVQLHQSPWFTTWLHAPAGTTLVGHTLQPLHGLVGIILGTIFPIGQVYNLIVTGSFVFSGVTAFWLARYVTGLYLPALIGGAAFTFTGFHFAHAQGHMELIATEFIPLFLLYWLQFLEDPTFLKAVAAALVLSLNIFCDLYLFSYAVLAGALCVLFYLPHLRGITSRRCEGAVLLVPKIGLFCILAGIFCGPLALALVIKNAHDPLIGSHDAAFYSADAMSAFIPGCAEMLGRFTQGYWTKLTSDPSEQCVYLGLSVIAMAVLGIISGGARRTPIALWVTLAAVAYVLSLGPILHLEGVEETGPVLPYAWLAALLPPLRLSGCPGRISILLALAVSILASLGVAALWRRGRWAKVFIVPLLALILTIDLWPVPSKWTPVIYPAWALALRDLPLRGAVISNVYANPMVELYCQTLYDRPMAFGYISRVPQSVEDADAKIMACARAGDFTALRREFHFVYLILPTGAPLPKLPIVYADGTVVIQELPAKPANAN